MDLVQHLFRILVHAFIFMHYVVQDKNSDQHIWMYLKKYIEFITLKLLVKKMARIKIQTTQL
jgi:hypothetical protein